MAEIALALLAGIATVASPCVLPVLPIVLGASWGQRDPRRPLWIVLGFASAFAAAVLAFRVSTHVLGVSHGAVRSGAAAALAVFGLLAMFPSAFERIAPALAPLLLAYSAGAGLPMLAIG